MDISFGNMKVWLNAFRASHQPPNKDNCFVVDVVIEPVEEAFPYILTEVPLEVCLSHFSYDEYDVDHSITEVNALLDEEVNALLDEEVNALGGRSSNDCLHLIKHLLLPRLRFPPNLS